MNLEGPWFHRGLMSARIPFTNEKRESDYRGYLSLYSHENFHFLQIVGTSYGQYISSLDSIRTNSIITLTKRLHLSGVTKLSIPLVNYKNIIEDGNIKRLVNLLLSRYLDCEDVEISLSTEVGTSYFDEYCNKYKRLLIIEKSLLKFYEEPCIDNIFSKTRWTINEAITGDRFGGNHLMEAHAKLLQWLRSIEALYLKDNPEKVPAKDIETFKLFWGSSTSPENLYSLTVQSFYEIYSKSYEFFVKYFPDANTYEQTYTYLVISDLALMSPLGCLYHDCWKKLQISWSDLQPGLRMIHICEAIKQAKMSLITDIETDYLPFTRKICKILDWPHPEEMVLNGIKILNSMTKNPIQRLHLKALLIREKTPWIFCLPRKALFDNLNIPIVILDDDIRDSPLFSPEEQGWLVYNAIQESIARHIVYEKQVDFRASPFIKTILERRSINDSDITSILKYSFGFDKDQLIAL